MVASKKQLAMEALLKAEEIRRAAGLHMSEPTAIFDLAEKHGLQIRFDRYPGLDGFYDKERQLIIISSLRPPGRQAYTCAHEFGHHLFGHGTSVLLAESVNNRRGTGRFHPDEILVDHFASFLLMPKVAVKNGFVRRHWQPDKATPEQIYAIAGWLGVGYATLIRHMDATLNLLPRHHAEVLLKVQPKGIRTRLLGKEIAENLILVDSHWTGRAVDVQVGDLVSIPSGVRAEGQILKVVKADASGTLLRATRSGIAKLEDDMDWSVFVRVSKREYVGVGAYRHWDDPDEEDFSD